MKGILNKKDRLALGKDLIKVLEKYTKIKTGLVQGIVISDKLNEPIEISVTLLL